MKKSLISLSVLGSTVCGVVMVVTRYTQAGHPLTSLQQPVTQPETQDPRFPFPVAPSGLSPLAEERLRASVHKNTVDPSHEYPGFVRPPEQQKEFEKVSDILEKLEPLPPQRLAYFAWLDSPDCPIRFRSWGCLVREVKPVPGGWTVTLVAMARAEDASGHPYDVLRRFVEEYSLTETGELKYVRGYPHPEDHDDMPRFKRFGGV